MASRDFYAVLGIGRDAKRDEIQRAYRRLARRWHPDVNKSPEAEERFKEVGEAYEVLSNPESRERYDRAGESAASAGAWTQDGVDGAGGGQWADFDLDQALGGLFRQRGVGPMRGPDQQAIVEVGLAEAYRGAQRQVRLVAADGAREVTASIPPGATDGQLLRLAGQGGRGRDGGPPGDLYLVVRLRPEPGFRVEGRDVFVDLVLAPWEAALGTQVTLQAPSGPVTVRVPPGSSSGRKLRLRGLGLPQPHGRAGDLYAEVRVVVPQHLGPAERRLFEELGRTSEFAPRRQR